MSDIREASLHWLNVTASFALGALLTWLAADALQRRRMSAPVSDEIVRERVNQRIAQVVTSPGDVHVWVQNGTVRLSGALPADERDELLTQLVTMPGVIRLRNALATSS
jgi:hypothetical protein